MKVVKFSTDVSKMSQIDSEIQAMTLLEHPNVVKLYEVIEGDKEI
jgi:serine/threonine protein kinase